MSSSPAPDGGSQARQPPLEGRRSRVGSLVLAAAVVMAGAALLAVAVRGPAQPQTMAERVRAVAATLRCPVCQNLTVADSPSRLAQEMRASIARDLQQGRTPDEIRGRFVDAYGAWILESPPKSGLDLMAWIAPAMLMAGGAVAMTVAVRRWTAGAPGRAAGDRADGGAGAGVRVDALSPADRGRLDRAMSATGEEPE